MRAIKSGLFGNKFVRAFASAESSIPSVLCYNHNSSSLISEYKNKKFMELLAHASTLQAFRPIDKNLMSTMKATLQAEVTAKEVNLEHITRILTHTASVKALTPDIQKVLEEEILKRFDQMTIPLYLRIITSLSQNSPLTKLLPPLLEDTGRKALAGNLSNVQLCIMVQAYTKKTIASQEFYTTLINSILNRIKANDSASHLSTLIAVAAEGFSKIGMTNPELFKKIEAAATRHTKKFSPKELLYLHRAFLAVQPKNASLCEKLVFHLLPSILELNYKEIIEFVKAWHKRYIQIWRSYMDLPMWQKIEQKLDKEIETCSMEDAIGMLECCRAVNLYSSGFLQKVIERLQNEPYSLSPKEFAKAFVLLVEFNSGNLEAYLEVVKNTLIANRKTVFTGEETLNILASLAYYEPVLFKESLEKTKEKLFNIDLEKLSGNAIRNYVFLLTSAKENLPSKLVLQKLSDEKQSEVLSSDPSIFTSPQLRTQMGKAISKILSTKGLAKRFTIQTQISDSHLNLIDVAIFRQKPYLSFTIPNNYAFIMKTKEHVMNNSVNKPYASWEMKKAVLAGMEWEVVELDQKELNKEGYLENKLQCLLLTK